MSDIQTRADDFFVFLVDDDDSVIRATSRLLTCKGYKVRSYLSGPEFLSDHDPQLPGCAVIDVSMPNLNGLQLQEKLTMNESGRPIIFLTGASDVVTSVKAMKAGAIDFLTKPVRSGDLLAAIETARASSEKSRAHQTGLRDVESRLAALTPRERQVLMHVARGRLNKQTAGHLGISIKTVKLHRGRAMQKMRIRTVAELVRLLDLTGLLNDLPKPG